MSLTVDTNVGNNLTTTFTFSTTLVGDNTILFGDGGTAIITNTTPVEYVYEEYGIYKPQIIDCNGVSSNSVSVLVNPHVSDSIAIESEVEEEFVGVESGAYLVSIQSNCLPPISVKLDVVGGTLPFEYKLEDNYKKDVTPKRYFTSNKQIEENIVTLNEEDLVEVYVDGYVVGYRGSFCFNYYEDQEGEYDICATLIRSCDLCEPQLEYI